MRYFLIYVTILLLPFVNSTLSSQREVAILKTDHQNRLIVHPNITSSGLSLPFMLDRNQIWLEASIEDQRGYFILDTGSPTLLLNSRGLTVEYPKAGIGAVGEVALQEHEVNSFSFAGIEQGKQEAYLLDLSGFEERSGNQLLGMIGYEQLEDYELLIDCSQEEMKLLPANKNILHNNTKPRFTLSFVYDQHLPIVTLRNGKQKLRFAIDTGAGVNLLNNASSARKLRNLKTLAATVNVEGLSGENQDLHYAQLPQLTFGETAIGATDFVLSDLSHLQPEDGRQIDGIIGPDLLKKFLISINFKKRKVYVW